MSPGHSAAGRGAGRAAGAAPMFAALGDETRLALVARLCAAGPLSTARLAQGAAISRQAIAKHLDVLAGAGLVRRGAGGPGRERRWEIEPRRLDEARRALEQISRRWDEALERLRKAVEEEP
ncbi:ArsR/SmtB family transcription factor [Anaeromyxobacter terrae]|uniref:ArsR/SmtB family transcription factor n=1 Tax=Anaeromyxobacter terrae TaxID=2925406 RepID=UPI001F586297|nr:helix-turn-helix domain-containing protein [Anaeromyxobacter sp. SG22]